MKTKPPSKSKPIPDHLNPESLTWRADGAINRLIGVHERLTCSQCLFGLLEEITFAEDEGKPIPDYLNKTTRGALISAIRHMENSIEWEVYEIIQQLKGPRRGC